jgi:two-component system, OmpR family, response regulator
MTASFRVSRVRPPVSYPARPSARPPHPPSPTSDSNELTVSITVRGEEAISAIAPLVAAVRSLRPADITVDQLPPLRPAADPHPGSAAALHIRVHEYCALLDGVPLKLTRREFDLLRFLAEHPRRVFSRSHLLQAVWGYDFAGGGRTVDVHVRRLRQKLGTRGPSISTVRGVGYRLDECDRVVVLGPHT